MADTTDSKSLVKKGNKVGAQTNPKLTTSALRNAAGGVMKGAGKLLFNTPAVIATDILASKETVTVPPTHAAEMRAYDTSVGEFRVHYAGFFDPGFGYNDSGAGSRAVLDVRSHDVPFVLEDRQRVGRLVYERLTATPNQIYGTTIGSNYQSQKLKLSKHFK